MVWIAVGMGVATLAVGAYSADKASGDAKDARRAGDAQAAAERERAQANQEKALELSDEQLQFQQDRYNAWESTYGSISKNLTNYYSTLSSESLIASSIKNLDTQFKSTQKNIQRSFAQRGIDSAAQDYLNQESQLGLAESKAEIRSNAPMQVAQMQSGFLANTPDNPNADRVSNSMGNKANAILGISGNQFQNANNIQARGRADAAVYAGQAQENYKLVTSGISTAISNLPARQPAGVNPALADQRPIADDYNRRQS